MSLNLLYILLEIWSSDISIKCPWIYPLKVNYVVK